MGQYYTVVKLSDDESSNNLEYIDPFNVAGGWAQLMAHSWVGNKLMGIVMKMMMPGQPWYKSKVVWAGSYYGNELGEIDYREFSREKGKEIVELPDSLSFEEQSKCFLINHTKQCFVDYSKLEGIDSLGDDYVINPLSLLTALGNNRGGGDYRSEHCEDLVGYWAFDVLSIDTKKPKSYRELVVDFEED